MSDTFGRRLRLERERRKISLISIADTTKINFTLLDALERDDLSRWPSGIFRRSFFKAYADAVGLEVGPLLREFAAAFPDPHEARTEHLRLDPPRQYGHSALRLTLDERWSPFAGAMRLVRQGRRWMAAAWDVGVVTAVATSAFVMFEVFWLPLALACLLYYVGGILAVGNTLGVFLFAPEPSQDNDPRPVPSPQRNDQEAVASRRDPLRLVRRA